MSDASVTSGKQKKPVQVGSRRWFWGKRAQHPTLWYLPVMLPLYGMVNQRHEEWHGLVSVATFLIWSPYVLGAVVVAAASRALWRVEINLAANRQHPFTDKDHTWLHAARNAAVGLMAYVVIIDLPDRVNGMTLDQLRHMWAGHNGVMVMAVLLATVMASLCRIHATGKVAHEELEKGV